MIDKKQKVLNQFYYKRNIFRLIEGFVNVVRCNGISKAANKMDLSPSVVSTQIATLEKEFGVCLMKRKGGVKFITLTKEGKVFYDSVNTIFVLLDQAIESLHKDFVESRNTVRIACHPLISRILLPQAVQELYRLKPDAKVEIKEIAYEAAITGIKNGEIDIALYPKDLDIIEKEKGIKYTKLFKYYPTVFSHPKHFTAQMNPEDIGFEHLRDGFVMPAEIGVVVDEKNVAGNVHIKISFHTVFHMVNIINGVACLDRRASTMQDSANLVIKDVPQLTQNSWFFAIQGSNIGDNTKNKSNTMLKIIFKQAQMID